MDEVIVVKDPTTGLPAVAETHYRVLESETEMAKLQDLSAQLDQVNQEIEALHAKHLTELDEVSSRATSLESDVRAQKSLVAGINDVASAAGDVDDGAVGDGSETEDAVETDESVAEEL